MSRCFTSLPNKVLGGCPQHQYSHGGLWQPEGKSRDTLAPNPFEHNAYGVEALKTDSNQAVELLR